MEKRLALAAIDLFCLAGGYFYLRMDWHVSRVAAVFAFCMWAIPGPALCLIGYKGWWK